MHQWVLCFSKGCVSFNDTSKVKCNLTTLAPLMWKSIMHITISDLTSAFTSFKGYILPNNESFSSAMNIQAMSYNFTYWHAGLCCS